VEKLSDYARSVLRSPRLEDKLRAPPADLIDDAAAAEVYGEPLRDPAIAMQHIKERLPPLHTLAERPAAAACVSRFAHHELMAIELFAWALLAFPELPPALRRGFVQALGEEQDHCRMYLARLDTLEVAFGALPLSGYFWRHIERIAQAPSPPLAFLCAQGLTLEQANLDFTLMFKDAFAQARDGATAAVLQKVHDDEIGHVKLAAHWLKRLGGGDELAAYREHVPFPYSLARAKARRFDDDARRRAGLSDAMIEAVRVARPYDKAATAAADAERA
jgi:uncharacterized ferritin-like protein (DUF455 family)